MMHQARIAFEQSRWLRPDAARWVRADAGRFLKPGTRVEDVYPALALKYNPNQPRVPAGHRGGGQWTSGNGGGRIRVNPATTEWESENEGSDDADTFEDTSFDGSDSDLAFETPGEGELDDIFAAHDSFSIYDPAPAGSDRITDPRIVSDADPEIVRPGEEYAQSGRGRGPTSVLINGRTVELSPGQAARRRLCDLARKTRLRGCASSNAIGSPHRAHMNQRTV